jgi:hypothetical protein
MPYMRMVQSNVDWNHTVHHITIDKTQHSHATLWLQKKSREVSSHYLHVVNISSTDVKDVCQRMTWWYPVKRHQIMSHYVALHPIYIVVIITYHDIERSVIPWNKPHHTFPDILCHNMTKFHAKRNITRKCRSIIQNRTVHRHSFKNTYRLQNAPCSWVRSCSAQRSGLGAGLAAPPQHPDRASFRRVRWSSPKEYKRERVSLNTTNKASQLRRSVFEILGHEI